LLVRLNKVCRFATFKNYMRKIGKIKLNGKIETLNDSSSQT